MPLIFANGATIIIAVLLVLAIAYRFYSAFIAAKVLALDPRRPTPAHTLADGHNYDSTNKWILFGHHFAAISGAGPLIGPVLAAQFGYLPGLLWILIGVCLAGTVQDFVILVLSIRRQGKSLAQIAFSEIGPASGTAATIGILFVLVIALAGLGKVVTKALGGESVKYAPGTQFVAADNRQLSKRGPNGSSYYYTIPVGTRVIYPNGAARKTSSQFTLSAVAPGGNAIDIEITSLPPGHQLRVPFGCVVGREGQSPYKPGTEFHAPDDALIQSSFVQNIYHYTIPAGTTIVPFNAADPSEVVKAAFEITARAMDLGTSGSAQRPQLNVPSGAVVTQVGAEGRVFPPQTQFVSAGRPITAQGLTNNMYRYTIPQGTRIIEPQGSEDVDPRRSGTLAPAAFDILVKPSDITITSVYGLRLLVPAKPEGLAVTQDIAGSSWGTFTIALTIPIALLIGIYLYRIRKNRVLEASIIGGALTLLAVYLGGQMISEDSFLYDYHNWFNLTEYQVGGSMAIYGFVASILPVWMLLCPRDYLSSFLKIGTVLLLVLGVIVAHPHLQAPAWNSTFIGGGPVVPGAVFPFVFITIMCGAVSGFHALVASGTTPKMIDKETDARPIGYGAMLIEGLVGIVALIAASAMPVQHYYEINTPAAKVPQYQTQIMEIASRDSAGKIIDQPLPDVGEQVQGRTGGAVTLALGMADILNTAVNNVIGSPEKPPSWLGDLFKYWYHFAIMFEALFILTTIDAGTRVGRFLLQETMGKWITPKLAQTDWWPSAILATALITFGWWYFLSFNAFSAIWEMFGIANQMLAVMALGIASAALARGGKKRYLAVTFVPMCFVLFTTGCASILKLIDYVRGMAGADPLNPALSAVCIIAILICTGIVVTGSLLAIRQSARKILP